MKDTQQVDENVPSSSSEGWLHRHPYLSIVVFVLLATALLCIPLGLASHGKTSFTSKYLWLHKQQAEQVPSHDTVTTGQEGNDDLLPTFPEFAVMLKTGTGKENLLIGQLETFASLVGAVMAVSDSDASVHFQGTTLSVVDVVKDVADMESISNLPEIHYYKSLVDHVRRSSTITSDAQTTTGNTDASQQTFKFDKDLGWKLDRFKMLSGAKRFYQQHPNFKWYLITDDDTYLFLANLRRLVEPLDHNKPYYLGGKVFGGPARNGQTLWFAYGGGGIILSHAAMALLASGDLAYLMAHYVKTLCCSDATVANALEHLGPVYLDVGLCEDVIFAGNPPWQENFNVHTLQHSIASFHHINRQGMRQLHDFAVNETRLQPFPALDVVLHYVHNKIEGARRLA